KFDSHGAGLLLSVGVCGVGVDGQHAEVAAIEAGLLDAQDGAGSDGRLVAVVLDFLFPSEAKAASRAIGYHASLTAHEQSAGGRKVGAGAVVVKADHRHMLVQHGVVDHAKTTLEDRVVAAFCACGSLLDFQPASRVAGSHGVLLEGRHHADIVAFTVDGYGLHGSRI